jgi:hypothetical protein
MSANVSTFFGFDYFGHKTLPKTKMQRVIELENNPYIVLIRLHPFNESGKLFGKRI